MERSLHFHVPRLAAGYEYRLAAPIRRLHNNRMIASNIAVPDEKPTRRELLRSGDQLAVAFLLVIALPMMFTWLAFHGITRGHWIEVDQCKAQTSHFEVDLNTATATELEQLPGIGPKIVQRIVESREISGPFARSNDLRRVKGIGVKTMEKIRPYVQTTPR
jgi:competence protein ComEA